MWSWLSGDWMDGWMPELFKPQGYTVTSGKSTPDGLQSLNWDPSTSQWAGHASGKSDLTNDQLGWTSYKTNYDLTVSKPSAGVHIKGITSGPMTGSEIEVTTTSCDHKQGSGKTALLIHKMVDGTEVRTCVKCLAMWKDGVLQEKIAPDMIPTPPFMLKQGLPVASGGQTGKFMMTPDGTQVTANPDFVPPSNSEIWGTHKPKPQPEPTAKPEPPRERKIR